MVSSAPYAVSEGPIGDPMAWPAGYTTRRFWLARLATGCVFFANGAAIGSWVPHIPDAKHALGLTDGLLGVALLGMAAGSLVGLPLSGVLTARFGSRTITRAALFALLLATPLPILAPSTPMFAIALMLLGMANGAVDVAMNTQAIAVQARFGRAIMSSFHGLFSVGGLAGAAVAALAMGAGVGPAPHLLPTVAGLLFPTFAVGAFLLPTPPAARSGFRLPQGPLIVLGVLTLCSLMAEGAIGDWAAVYLRDDLAAGVGFAALGFAAFSLAMAAGRFLGDRIVRRCGGPAVLAAGSGIAALLLAAALLLHNPAAALVGFAVVGLGLANAVPILFSAAGKIPGILPEIAIAGMSTAGYCGFLLGPPVIGVIAERFTLSAGLAVVAVALTVIAFGGANVTSPERRRRWMASSSGLR
jgi:MFS family permease